MQSLTKISMKVWRLFLLWTEVCLTYKKQRIKENCSGEKLQMENLLGISQIRQFSEVIWRKEYSGYWALPEAGRKLPGTNARKLHEVSWKGRKWQRNFTMDKRRKKAHITLFQDINNYILILRRLVDLWVLFHKSKNV